MIIIQSNGMVIPGNEMLVVIPGNEVAYVVSGD